jgi:beta-galactosidase
VDQDGRGCPNADNFVKFNIKGKGVIAGVDNGNPISHEYFQTNERKTFHGLCLVVIQSEREPGTIRLTAKSEGLREAELSIQVK